MKIKYEFVDGRTVEIEVDERVGKVILDDRRREANDNRKHRRWCLPLNEQDDKSLHMADPSSDAELAIAMEEEASLRIKEKIRLELAMNELTDKQRELVEAIFYKGMSQAEYAKKNGLDKSTVSKRYAMALKKIQKYF